MRCVLILKMFHKLLITLLAEAFSEIWGSMNNYFQAVKCELFFVYLWI